MAYLLDTDWAIQTLAGREPAASTLRRLPANQVGVCVLTTGELYEGAYNSANPGQRVELLRRFLNLFSVITIDEAIMIRFAEIRAHLRRSGQLLPDFDLVIAATALEYDLTLLTLNRKHFTRIADLRLFEPNRG